MSTPTTTTHYPSPAETNGQETNGSRRNGNTVPPKEKRSQGVNFIEHSTTSYINTLKSTIKGQPELIEALVGTLIVRRFPTLLIGHSGTGKTFGVEELAALALDNPRRQFKKIVCGPETTKATIFGYIDPRTNEYVKGVFDEDKVIYLFDEFARLPEETQGLLLEVLEHRVVRLDNVPHGKGIGNGKSDDEVVKLHPNAVFFLTANTDEDSGSNPIVQPLLERMGVVYRCNHASEATYVDVALHDNPLSEPTDSLVNQEGDVRVKKLDKLQEYFQKLACDRSFKEGLSRKIGKKVSDIAHSKVWDPETVPSMRTVKASVALANVFLLMRPRTYRSDVEQWEELVNDILHLTVFNKVRLHRNFDRPTDGRKLAMFRKFLYSTER